MIKLTVNTTRHSFIKNEHDDDYSEFCSACGIQRFCEPSDPRINKCRPPWHHTWMYIARTVAERSCDVKLKVGAIIVAEDNTQMLSMGYNGSYKGGPNRRESEEEGKGGLVHAETNCLIKCDYNFSKRKHMYITHSPCYDCAKLIINAEIVRVVYDIPYRDLSGLDLLNSVGIEVFDFNQM